MLVYEVVDSADHRLAAAAKELFLEYADELSVDLCFQGFTEEVESLPGKYCPPRGVLFVVTDESAPIACGAFRELDESTCELKRIYVRQPVRGKGIGREITVSLMKCAKDAGYHRVRLDTLRQLTGAIRLYESLGFIQIPPYSPNPGLDIVYFEMAL